MLSIVNIHLYFFLQVQIDAANLHYNWEVHLNFISHLPIYFLIYLPFLFSKVAAQFQSMEVRNSKFAAFIDVFTSNTYVMVITSDAKIRMYLTYILFK